MNTPLRHNYLMSESEILLQILSVSCIITPFLWNILRNRLTTGKKKSSLPWLIFSTSLLLGLWIRRSDSIYIVKKRHVVKLESSSRQIGWSCIRWKLLSRKWWTFFILSKRVFWIAFGKRFIFHLEKIIYTLILKNGVI